jgi:hypothetical protein
LDLYSRSIDAPDLVVPGDEVAQREELGPVGAAVGNGVLILERPVPDPNADRFAPADEAAEALEELRVHVRQRQGPDAELAGQQGIEAGARQFLDLVGARGGEGLRWPGPDPVPA